MTQDLDLPIAAVNKSHPRSRDLTVHDHVILTVIRGRRVVRNEDFLVEQNPRERQRAGLAPRKVKVPAIARNLAEEHMASLERLDLVSDSCDLRDCAIDSAIPVEVVLLRVGEIEHSLSDVPISVSLA